MFGRRKFSATTTILAHRLSGLGKVGGIEGVGEGGSGLELRTEGCAGRKDDTTSPTRQLGFLLTLSPNMEFWQ